MTHTAARLLDSYGVVIVGAGHAGTQLVSELLAAGYERPIAIVDSGSQTPYERPPLSKALLKGEVEPAQLSLRSDAFWTTAGLHLITGETVVDVDDAAHLVRTGSGLVLKFDHLVWAAGGRPRPLDVPGSTLRGVHQLATLDDSLGLREAIARGGRFVIVGGGFIGLEVAAACAEAGVSVRVLERETRLLARVTGSEISEYFLRLHRNAGVDVSLGVDVVGFSSNGTGEVSAVELSSGESVAADAVLVAVGLVPTIDPLRAAGAAVSNGVQVDELGRTTLPDVYAIGDCALFPVAGQGLVRLESINNAVERAAVVAAHITGDGSASASSAPWFWSNQYATKFKSVGLVRPQHTRIVRGDQASEQFSVVYLSGSTVTAVDCVNHTRDYVAARKIVGSSVSLERIRDPATPLRETVLAGPSAEL